MQKFEIVNILTDSFWYKKVIDSIPKIVLDNHKLVKNYADLEERLNQYECFTAVYDSLSEQLVAISGVFNGGRFPSNCARILDRTYYYDWKSSPTSSFNNNYQFNTNIVIPYQVEFATKKGFDIVFFSMEGLKKRNVICKMAERQKLYPFEVLPDMYNTCKSLPDGTLNSSPSCRQNIAIHYINNEAKFSLPISINDAQ